MTNTEKKVSRQVLEALLVARHLVLVWVVAEVDSLVDSQADSMPRTPMICSGTF
jgi:hypothetical protein